MSVRREWISWRRTKENDPSGKSPRSRQTLSSPFAKNILLSFLPKSPACLEPSRPSEGRLAIVTNAGRDAVDADALLTNSV